jgi:acyl-CoA thioesterase FadM
MDARAKTSSKLWTTDVLLRFNHCDPAGIIHFPRAFDILNNVVEDWFVHCLGLDYYDIVGRRRIGLGYAHAECDFVKPATMGNVLTLAVRVERLGNKSLALAVTARRGAEDILKASMVIVATDLTRHASIPLPDDVRKAVTDYQEKTG